jgi:hypothetical protein
MNDMFNVLNELMNGGAIFELPPFLVSVSFLWVIERYARETS